MKINRAEIENYRNIEHICVDFNEINIIYGENAQGKTNLLEALYLFTGAKSFRGASDGELIRFSADFARMKADFVNKNREQSAEIIIKGKRSASLNGIKKTSPSALGDEIKAVIFSPSHLYMIKEGPAGRRKFTDGALCQLKSNYRGVLREYNRCLLQRNVLLKDLQQNTQLYDLLYIWNRNLARAGAKIIYQRERYINALLPFAKDIYAGLSGGSETLGLKIKGAFDYSGISAADAEGLLIKELEKNQAADMAARATTAGPHRDDLEITVNSKSARNFGSQGQQRSCVLALKLAEASLLKEMTGEEPIALLDDVMSELDEKRQDYILNHIKDGQVFITCCDKNTVLRLKKGKTVKIEGGKAVED